MLTYTYISKGKFGFVEKTKPKIQHERDAIVKVTLKLIAEGKLDTEPLLTHTYKLSKIDEAYELLENNLRFKLSALQSDSDRELLLNEYLRE